MARLIRHDANRPALIREEDVEKFPIAICMCGLSKNKPLCDGSHRRAGDEEEGEIYLYDDEGRVKAGAHYPRSS